MENDPLPSQPSELPPTDETNPPADADATIRRRVRSHAGRSVWWSALLVVLALAAGVGIGYLLWGQPLAQADAELNSLKAANTAAESAQATQSAQQVHRYNIPVDDDPSIGPKDAPITLIEFSDYQCPYCKKWHDEVLPSLLKDYQGKLRYVYRDFPLSGLHAQASPAAMAADCAGEQGDYFQYADKLFSDQYDLGETAFLQYASDLKLDATKFKECLDSNRYQSEVEKDYQFAAQLGISSTPTFFINGLAVVGAQPLDVFKMVIDKELAGEIPK